jgi:hypothetical protein
MKLIEWEEIDGRGLTFRAKVPGGWLIKALEVIFHPEEYLMTKWGLDYRVTVTFIPDPIHEWGKCESETKP